MLGKKAERFVLPRGGVGDEFTQQAVEQRGRCLGFEDGRQAGRAVKCDDYPGGRARGETEPPPRQRAELLRAVEQEKSTVQVAGRKAATLGVEPQMERMKTERPQARREILQQGCLTAAVRADDRGAPAERAQSGEQGRPSLVLEAVAQ